MNTQKESKIAFEGEVKESIADRLRALIGTRTVRAAARDWGLSFSTLNNYLTRGTEPSLNVAIKISNVEHVSVEWIATGENSSSTHTERNTKSVDDNSLRNAWISAFEFMSKSESEALLRLMLKEGASGILKLGSNNQQLNESLLALSPELKQRALELINAHEEAKKGASDGGELTAGNRPMIKEQKAG
ncbi:hypothetical protein BTJ39_14320 [Izhakiella australiensis]|uniref:HTH cro/C1-type domain-containing protein n=1 Tax=Izhakiella australiensis TaxID=1926881 RepID=A0A1S8YKM6_9GAMM|nr:transcriptional regulator [Izhakiella australiensis]OON39448.1 hypothetical protein BTJ39_14320 [Izhakiella australiensis]